MNITLIAKKSSSQLADELGIFTVPENETPQLVIHPLSGCIYESRNANQYTCYGCPLQDGCKYAFDLYNTKGDCLNGK